jgi:hypothetical protein
VWNIVERGERQFGRNGMCLKKNVEVKDGRVRITTLREVRVRSSLRCLAL